MYFAVVFVFLQKSTEKSQKKVDIISRPKKGSVAAAFNDEVFLKVFLLQCRVHGKHVKMLLVLQSDEEEEIPKEAKMRMRNLGKYVNNSK